MPVAVRLQVPHVGANFDTGDFILADSGAQRARRNIADPAFLTAAALPLPIAAVDTC